MAVTLRRRIGECGDDPMKGLLPWVRELIFGPAKIRCASGTSCGSTLSFTSVASNPECLKGYCTGCCNRYCGCGRPKTNDDPELAELRRMLK